MCAYVYCVCDREQKLSKEHDIAVNRLNDWKRRYLMTLTETQKVVNDFKTKDRMSEAESYVHLLDDTARRLEDFTLEVTQCI